MNKVPFVIYAEFESVLAPLEHNEAAGRISRHFQEHLPCGYIYQIVCREPDLYTFPVRTYSGEHFMTRLLEGYDQIMEFFNKSVPMNLTREEKLALDE